MIDGAKSQWALENKKPATATPVEQDLWMPECPAGGEYTINSLNESPRCSNPEHKMKE
jgi:hypothetical protein